MDEYKIEVLEKVKGIINRLEDDDVKRIILDLDDSYIDETEINITIELNKTN